MTTRRKGYSTKQVLDELLGDSDSDVDFTSSNTDSEDAVSDDARSESDTDDPPTCTGILLITVPLSKDYADYAVDRYVCAEW